MVQRHYKEFLHPYDSYYVLSFISYIYLYQVEFISALPLDNLVEKERKRYIYHPLNGTLILFTQTKHQLLMCFGSFQKLKIHIQ